MILDFESSKSRKILFGAILFILVIFAFMGLQVVSKYVGYASFAGKAGNIYTMVIEHRIPAQQWSSSYGVGVRVDGYMFPQSSIFSGGEIQNKNLLFDCLEPDIPHEIYASIYPTDSLDLSVVTPATAQQDYIL